jgi:ribosomal protein L11 methyltransferase
MATRALHFKAPVAVLDELQGYLLTHFNVEGLEEPNDGSTICYVTDHEWDEDAIESLRGFLATRESIELIGSEVIEERDWNAEWESSIEPLKITDNLTITPSWKLEDAARFETPYTIVIDPKMSFGTGHHETTRLCLRAIDSLPVEDLRVLDVGTGSGVLAIYALLRGARHAIGIDTDEWSIDNAQENRTLNRLNEDQLEIRAGTLDETITASERFEIILANIHRNVLMALAERLKSHLAPGGTLVLSGLLIYDADDIRREYESRGFRFVLQDQENEWVSLTFTR